MVFMELKMKILLKIGLETKARLDEDQQNSNLSNLLLDHFGR